MRSLAATLCFLALASGCSGVESAPADAQAQQTWPRRDAATTLPPSSPGGDAGSAVEHAPSDATTDNADAAAATPDAGHTPAGPTTFAQGLYRGEDPRVRRVNGHYYWVANEGRTRKLFRSDSLVDRGVGKPVPPQGGAAFPLFAPVYIETLNGQRYDAWFAFDTNVWRCDCADPYDDPDQWQVVKSIPLTGWSIDFEIFQMPEPGPFAGRSYLVWAGADSPSTGWGFESCFIAELLDLRPNQPTLSTFDNGDANRIATFAFDWTDVVAEAPAPAIHDGTVSIVYSGNGAHTVEYALGLVILKAGADPASGASWIDHNRGECDGDVKNGPELMRTERVFGPGVARFTVSPNGSEDWMVYHAKVFETFNRGAGTPGQQDNNEMWARYFNLEPIGWREGDPPGRARRRRGRGAEAGRPAVAQQCGREQPGDRVRQHDGRPARRLRERRVRGHGNASGNRRRRQLSGDPRGGPDSRRRRGALRIRGRQERARRTGLRGLRALSPRHSGTASPVPPISLGRSFNLGRPSLMRNTVSA